METFLKLTKYANSVVHISGHYEYYSIIDLCWCWHGVLSNSKRHIDRRGAEVNMIKFTIQ